MLALGLNVYYLHSENVRIPALSIRIRTGRRMTPGARLRQRLHRGQILIAPGASDAITARVIEEAGGEVVYFTGAGFANSQFGVPDLGLVTMSETVSQVQRVTDAVSIPVVADADTGYGGVHNVMRTVRALERAGVAAIQIEDQSVPKRCGHFDRKEVVTTAEMIARIHAACEARRDPSLVIIARTDAREVEGLTSALDRARAYAQAGADVLFVEAPRSLDEVRAIPTSVPVPTILNLVEGGHTPLVVASELEKMGYRMVIYANTALRVAAKAVQDAMQQLLLAGTSEGLEDRMLTWDERQTLVRLAQYEALETALDGPITHIELSRSVERAQE